MRTSCDEGWDSEEFFDSAECLPVEESDWCNIVSVSSGEYAVWLSEPQSVEQRRKLFLLRSGLSEWGSPVSSSSEDRLKIDGDSTQIHGINRLTETSEAIPSASYCLEDNLLCSRNEVDSSWNSVVSDRVHSIMETGMLEVPEMKRDKRSNESSFWKLLLGKVNDKRSVIKHRAPSRGTRKIPALRRVNAYPNKKRLLELSALYSSQDIQAHNGIIWTMKFSHDGQFLATGGEDGIVCLWRVILVDASSEEMYGGSEIYPKAKSIYRRASILKPDKFFWIDEFPVQVFHGHTGGILDLAWSSSNRLLSSSKDETVRLWHVGCDVCQDVFRHSNYVTCIQFNPVDDDHFISGSIDGKARVWNIATRRVMDWADVQDVITAICYRPHGKGFSIGTIAGTCHFYEIIGTEMQRDVMIRLPARRKRNSSNRITSIQFSNDTPGRVLISSQDSKLHVFEGNDIIYKYKGPKKSGSQMSASFSLTKNHTVSVGEDSRVYLWNQGEGITKSVPSCEYFFSEGASVAVTWSGNHAVKAISTITLDHCRMEHERFSSAVKWLSRDSKRRTWPEEVLEAAVAGDEKGTRPIGETWGVVFVTGSKNGRIRTFHNYGLPVRL